MGREILGSEETNERQAEELGSKRSGLLRFCPHRFVRSVTEIEPQELVELGIRAIILDLDNTVVPWQEEEMTGEVRRWLQAIKQCGMGICLLSNSLKQKRSQRIAQRFGLHTVGWARKPSRFGFQRALELLGTTPKETAVIGDQMFTDIFGGNRMGMYTIMVRPLHSREFLYTRFVSRPPERFLLWFFRRKGYLKEGAR